MFGSSGNSIDVQLIAGGFAVAWIRDGQYLGVLTGLEDSARLNHVGCLWGVSAPISLVLPTSTAVQVTPTVTATTHSIAIQVVLPTPTVVQVPPMTTPTPQSAEVFWPAEIDFLRGWGGRQPWTKLPPNVDSTFLAYRSLWVSETVIDSSEWSQESFRKFVSGPTPDFPVRARTALDILLEHPSAVIDSAPWIYEPRSNPGSTVGCGLAYLAARQRYGSFLRSLGDLSEYCTRPLSPWNSYQSFALIQDKSLLTEIEKNSDWIEYISYRLLGIE